MNTTNLLWDNDSTTVTNTAGWVVQFLSLLFLSFHTVKKLLNWIGYYYNINFNESLIIEVNSLYRPQKLPPKKKIPLPSSLCRLLKLYRPLFPAYISFLAHSFLSAFSFPPVWKYFNSKDGKLEHCRFWRGENILGVDNFFLNGGIIWMVGITWRYSFGWRERESFFGGIFLGGKEEYTPLQ